MPEVPAAEVAEALAAVNEPEPEAVAEVERLPVLAPDEDSPEADPAELLLDAGMELQAVTQPAASKAICTWRMASEFGDRRRVVKRVTGISRLTASAQANRGLVNQ